MLPLVIFSLVTCYHCSGSGLVVFPYTPSLVRIRIILTSQVLWE